MATGPPARRTEIRTPMKVPVQGNLYSRARVAYCQSLEGRSFAIGVELRQATADWTPTKKHSL